MKRSRTKKLGAAVAATLAVTTPAHAPAQTPKDAPPKAPSRAPQAEAPAKLLADGVSTDAPARRRLYTWTTAEQIAELGKGSVLLSRSESKVHGPTLFTQTIAARAGAGDAIAKLLNTTAYACSRHAWPSAWPTLRGVPGERYGDHLIQIELKPESWLIRFTLSTSKLDAVDLDNRAVRQEEVLAHPERVAAVYFVHDVPTLGSSDDTFRAPLAGAFREYVVCNESMVASWSVGTPAIAAELEQEAAMLDSLPAMGPAMASDWPKAVIAAWKTRPASTVDEAYKAALAFAAQTYRPSVISDLPKELRAVPKDVALTGTPKVVFPAELVPRPQPVPRPPPPHRGTY